jgi:hypothetical protein
VGGGYPETGLSDITLGWMMGKSVGLGLQLDPKVLASYSPLDATNALDQIHESWSPLWLFPKSRTIAPDASLANSAAIRCEYDVDYAPENLKLNNDVPVGTYTPVNVVTPAPAVQN